MMPWRAKVALVVAAWWTVWLLIEQLDVRRGR